MNLELSVQSLEEISSDRLGIVKHIELREELTDIPRIILERAPYVEILDLSSNQLDHVPEWIGELTNLRVLFLSNNRFSEVPTALRHCKNLRMLGMRANQIENIPLNALPDSLEWLTLTDNHLSELPKNLGYLKSLRKLLLAGNKLTHLPESLAAATNLELIRLSANNFENFPEWLFKIPSLAWIALAGNPSTVANRKEINHKNSIPWNELQIIEELGRGASGTTYSARHVTSDWLEKMVAVKVFSSDISSDGHAQDEITVALCAGQHPNLTSTLATFSGHPDGKSGLVLDLLPKGCKNLAAPPSFESCTRDVYQKDLYLTYSQATTYAIGIAKAALHLHQNAIIHGDLYAHNILVNSSQAVLSDLGAACLYARCPALPVNLLERIEVRAFGIFLNELLELVQDEKNINMLKLKSLAADCMQPSVINRPNFNTVLHKLN